jgi:tRNA threonylcarbamoyladenosine biosynthesis protein TsaE
VRALGKPMTATSANGSGEKRPYSVADIMGGLSEKQKNLIDLVLDVGELPHRPPSTVIDTTLSTPVTFRQGDVVVTATEQNDAAMERYITESVRETQDLAGKLMLKHWDAIKQTGLIVGLDGSLGMGKTIFTKGIATFLHITDTITSPTYTYQEEYPFERHGVRGMLYHLDAWKVDAAAQWQRLGVTKHVGAGHVIVIEWWDQVAAFAGFPTNIPLVHVQLKGRRWNMDQERTIRVWTTPAAAATAATPAPDVPSGLSELGAPGAPEK